LPHSLAWASKNPTLFGRQGTEYRSILVISEIKLLYTVSEDTLFIEFVKNARMDDATMLEKLNQEL